MSDNPVFQQIEDLIKQNDVMLFMKGNADSPMCGFSGVVTHIMRLQGVDFNAFNVMSDQEVREGIKAYTNWPTIPQLYVKGEFIGGCDIVKEMHESGELAELFEQKGIARNQ